MLGLGLAACSDTDRVTAPPPQFAVVNVPVTLKLQMPDGSNPCGALGGTGTFRFQLFNRGTRALVRSAQASCPAAQFTFGSVPTGDYDANFTLMAANDFGSYPRRWMQTVGEISGATTVVSDLIPGELFGGGMTIDGVAIDGAEINLLHDGYPQISTFGLSKAAGGWSDALTGQANLRLRPGQRFNVTGCNAIAVSGGPSAPQAFTFPTELDEFNCDYTTSYASRFTHRATELVASLGPADIGGFEEWEDPTWGTGYGLQYPVDPAVGPRHVPANISHVFTGGLIIGIEPGIILSGAQISGYAMDCVGPCRDFGNNALVHMTANTPHGRTMTWHYSDAQSAEGVGLDVVQTSYDGIAPNDYVLIRYSFHNKGKDDLTFYAGGFYDLDIEELGAQPSEAGGSEFDGRLMYNVGNAGTHVGTYMIGDYPQVGAWHFVNTRTNNQVDRITIAQQMAALRGDVRALTTARADARYMQSLGPIHLKKGHKAEVWIALVAGRTRTEIIANALAAEADSNDKRRGVAASGLNANSAGVVRAPRAANQSRNVCAKTGECED